MKYPTVLFKSGFSKIDEFEMPLKGFRPDVVVQLPNGKYCKLYYYDTVRLNQELNSEAMHYFKNFIAEPGLVIVSNLTKEIIESSVNELFEIGYFDHLKQHDSY